MTHDSSAIWQEIMANWQAGQDAMTKQMLSNFEQWNAAFSGNQQTIKSNPILETYQTIIESFFKNYSPSTQSGFASDWEKYFTDMPNAQELVTDIKKLMETGNSLFKSLTKEFRESINGDESHQYLLKALLDMSNPNSWLKYSGDNFDISAHKLSEGPLFSGISDIDNRLAQVTDSWLELFNRSKAYHAIVFGRWTEAYSRFLEDVKSLDEDAQKQLSPRKLIDMWSSIANDELMSLHRSEEFLSAQRGVIRASMQYRLHEKKVAEVICEALHIPTRDEIDDLHKTVTELRRELRQLKSANQQQQQVLDQLQANRQWKQQPTQLPGAATVNNDEENKH